MKLTANQEALLADVKAKLASLPAAAQIEAVKTVRFVGRFEWVRVALAAATALLIGTWIGAHL